jgi:hypothetical protein
MACESEWGDVAASAVAVAAGCATVETGIGAAVCAAAIWKYYRAVDGLSKCRTAAGLSSLDDYANSIYAEAEYMQQVAESAGQTVSV